MLPANLAKARGSILESLERVTRARGMRCSSPQATTCSHITPRPRRLKVQSPFTETETFAKVGLSCSGSFRSCQRVPEATLPTSALSMPLQLTDSVRHARSAKQAGQHWVAFTRNFCPALTSCAQVGDTCRLEIVLRPLPWLRLHLQASECLISRLEDLEVSAGPPAFFRSS